VTQANVIIGSRGSKLALWQSEHVRDRLETANPGISIELKIIKTTGDKILDSPLSKIGDKGLFTRQIEDALLAGEIDLAVHSLKDLPTALPEGLVLGAVSVREDPSDVLVGKTDCGLFDLPEGAQVATSSLRRRAQIAHRRPDLVLTDIRGNLDTRLRKLQENPELDGIILARAGLVRLGFGDRITEVLSADKMLSAVGQGALGIEIRDGDKRIAELIEPLNDPSTFAATEAERALLARLEGGCQIPIGALGVVDGETITLEAMVASLDGKSLLRDRMTGPADDPKKLGERLAENLLSAGAGNILDAIRAEAN
jgi:hydroxymethylbilane synthase